jgi:hypothetical protein
MPLRQRSAVEILGETGRTDFTVQEVVARSKTIIARLLPALQQQGRIADRPIGEDDGAVGAGLARRDHRADSTGAIKLIIDRISAGLSRAPGQPESGDESQPTNIWPKPGHT